MTGPTMPDAPSPWEPCPSKCRHDRTKYLRDSDHDGGTCEVVECLDCERVLHYELPD